MTFLIVFILTFLAVIILGLIVAHLTLNILKVDIKKDGGHPNDKFESTGSRM